MGGQKICMQADPIINNNTEIFLQKLKEFVSEDMYYLVDILSYAQALPCGNFKKWKDAFGNDISFISNNKIRIFRNLPVHFQFKKNLHHFDLNENFVWKAEFQAKYYLKNLVGKIYLTSNNELKSLLFINNRSYVIPILFWDIRFLKKIFGFVKQNKNCTFRSRGLTTPISCRLKYAKFILGIT